MMTDVGWQLMAGWFIVWRKGGGGRREREKKRLGSAKWGKEDTGQMMAGWGMVRVMKWGGVSDITSGQSESLRSFSLLFLDFLYAFVSSWGCGCSGAGGI